MSNSQENLQSAFAGESQANRKYLFFAQKAEEEGYKQAARLFRAAADAETVHARNHLLAMGGIKTTRENLQAAIGGEHYEFTKMYPEFLKQAQSEKSQEAQISFYRANKVEEIHHGMYQAALKSVDAGVKAAADKPIYVCQVCGNTVEGEPPGICPICAAPRDQFKQIE